ARSVDPGCSNAVPAFMDEIAYHAVEYSSQAFAQFQFGQCVGIALFDLKPDPLERRQMLTNCLDGNDSRFDTIIQIGNVVADLVRQIDKLRLKRWPLIQQILSQLREFVDIPVTRMLDDTFANLEREIQAPELGIAQLKILRNP